MHRAGGPCRSSGRTTPRAGCCRLKRSLRPRVGRARNAFRTGTMDTRSVSTAESWDMRVEKYASIATRPSATTGRSFPTTWASATTASSSRSTTSTATRSSTRPTATSLARPTGRTTGSRRAKARLPRGAAESLGEDLGRGPPRDRRGGLRADRRPGGDRLRVDADRPREDPRMGRGLRGPRRRRREWSVWSGREG